MKPTQKILSILILFLMPYLLFGQEETSSDTKGTYEGEMKKNYKHGQGTFTWDDGTKYKGNWRYNLMHGEGKMSWTNGAYYLGEWREGRKHGRGKFFWPNGDTYVGGWVDGKQSGNGKYTYANKVIVEGIFKSGKLNGQGVKTWPNGQKYEGEFKNGKMEGSGFIVYPDGEARVGTWSKDEFMPCVCPQSSVSVENAFVASDAVFIGIVTGLISTDDGYLARMEIFRHWKGEWFTNRSIFLEGGYSSCDFVYSEGQTYLVYANKQSNSAYAGVYSATRCSRTTLIENVINDLEILDSKIPCKGEAINVPFETTSDPVCGCDEVTYKNAYKAAKAGVQVWTAGACEAKEE